MNCTTNQTRLQRLESFSSGLDVKHKSLGRNNTADLCCDFRSDFLLLKDVKEYLHHLRMLLCMRIDKARTFITDPLFFIAQKKKS